MGTLDAALRTLKGWLGREASEAKQWSEATANDLHANLDRREAELKASPEERMKMIQNQVSANDDAFAQIQADIEARAETSTEIDPTEPG